ncbi:CLUMA_CG008842, isoform A [Clunio marinus]|uniref:CLUMA_CG008842, isoform A n=1 Tax=Clunio marinus TaxID=568069 RepID=A0A1J1I4U8_9DIPT|nr:CLUMA_CG008842, isoform A [Clunio marinus]
MFHTNFIAVLPNNNIKQKETLQKKEGWKICELTDTPHSRERLHLFTIAKLDAFSIYTLLLMLLLLNQ